MQVPTEATSLFVLVFRAVCFGSQSDDRPRVCAINSSNKIELELVIKYYYGSFGSSSVFPPWFQSIMISIPLFLFRTNSFQIEAIHLVIQSAQSTFNLKGR